jgi:hypothetical protein
MEADPTDSEPVESSSLLVNSVKGVINVRTTSGFISSLQIYNVSGALIYSDNTLSTEYRIPVPGQKVYIVRALIGGAVNTAKVIVE